MSTGGHVWAHQRAPRPTSARIIPHMDGPPCTRMSTPRHASAHRDEHHGAHGRAPSDTSAGTIPHMEGHHSIRMGTPGTPPRTRMSTMAHVRAHGRAPWDASGRISRHGVGHVRAHRRAPSRTLTGIIACG